MQPILVSCEAPFRSNLQKKWSIWGHTGPVRVMTLTGPVFFFCKLLQNGALHDTKIGFISLVSAGADK